MPNTLAGVRSQMFELEPSLGAVYNIASLAAQTLTVTALATGQVQSGKYLNKWLLRPQATDAANRNPRIVSDFSSTTGLFTHTGLAYTDLTATNETVEVHEYEPRLIDLAVQRALETCRFRDEAILPCNASGIYWLNEYDWIVDPSDILEVSHDAFPVLSNNRFLQQWNGYSSAGALVPDYFSLTGTFTRQTGSKRGKYVLRAPGSAWEVSQTVGLMEVDVDASTLRGQTVTAVLVGSAATSQAKVTVTDGDDTTDSSNLGTTRGEVTAEHVISDDATTLRFYASGTATADIEELYLCFGQVNDGVRIGSSRLIRSWPGWALNWRQGQPLRMDALGVRGYGTRLLLASQRPYSRFDDTRVAAGTADADETDAPSYMVACRALAIFFEDRANGREGTAEDASKAALWGLRADRARMQHFASNDGPGFNDTILEQRGTTGVSARGIR